MFHSTHIFILSINWPSVLFCVRESDDAKYPLMLWLYYTLKQCSRLRKPRVIEKYETSGMCGRRVFRSLSSLACLKAMCCSLFLLLFRIPLCWAVAQVGGFKFALAVLCGSLCSAPAAGAENETDFFMRIFLWWKSLEVIWIHYARFHYWAPHLKRRKLQSHLCRHVRISTLQ